MSLVNRFFNFLVLPEPVDRSSSADHVVKRRETIKLLRIINWLSVSWSVLFALIIGLFVSDYVNSAAGSDIWNYMTTVDELSWDGFSYLGRETQWIDYFKNEYIWFLIMYSFSSLWITTAVAFKLVSAISAFIVHRFISARVGLVLATLFLLNPILLDLICAQVRSGFAFALFLLVVSFNTRKLVLWLAIPILALIHSAMFVICPLYFVFSHFRQKRAATDWKEVIFAIGLGFVLAYILAVSVPQMMVILHDRRSQIVVENVTLAYVAFWFLFGVALALSFKRTKAFSGEYLFSICILIFAPTLVFFDFSGFRFISLAYPVVVGSCGQLYTKQKYSMLGLLGLYQIVLYSYWIPQHNWDSIGSFG